MCISCRGWCPNGTLSNASAQTVCISGCCVYSCAAAGCASDWLCASVIEAGGWVRLGQPSGLSLGPTPHCSPLRPVQVDRSTSNHRPSSSFGITIINQDSSVTISWNLWLPACRGLMSCRLLAAAVVIVIITVAYAHTIVIVMNAFINALHHHHNPHCHDMSFYAD